MSEAKTAGIILAAGRGSRMKELTAQKPKCLLTLSGRPLLHWQLDAMAACGIQRPLVVRGYAADCLQGDFATVDNPRWSETNMLSSLLCARNFISDFFAGGGQKLLVSYSDIVWNPAHGLQLLRNPAHIAITCDLLWEKLWRLRFDDPLSDAETFVQKDGSLREIGNKTTDISQIQGQYMGLLAFDGAGWKTTLAIAEGLGVALDKTDMTTFLRLLLAQNVPIGVTSVSGGWCEADNAHDIAKYEEALAAGNWSHDWR